MSLENDYRSVESSATSLFTLSLSYLSQAYVVNPKQDLHGLGYDPFKQAPEFRGMSLSGFEDDYSIFKVFVSL